jgi:anti-sigma regulatory factor (Ser/Thr protein kinase)
MAPEAEDRIREFLADPVEPEMTQEFDLTEKDFINAGKASAEIKLTLKRLGVDGNILRRVAIACYEAEINVVAHSRGGTLQSNIHNELVYLRFQDCGPGMADIQQALQPGYSTADDIVREMGFGAGMGLPNIQKNSDFMRIHSEKGKNTLLELMIFF